MNYLKPFHYVLVAILAAFNAYSQNNLDRVFPKEKTDKRLIINNIKHTPKETTIEIEMQGFDAINLWRPATLNSFVITDTFNKKLYTLNKITDIKIGTKGYYEVLLKEFTKTTPIPSNLRYVNYYANVYKSGMDSLISGDSLASAIDSMNITSDSTAVAEKDSEQVTDSISRVIAEAAASAVSAASGIAVDTTIMDSLHLALYKDSVNFRDSLATVELEQRDSNSISMKYYDGESIIATLHFDNLQKLHIFNLIEGEHNAKIKAGGYFNFYKIDPKNTLRNLYADAEKGNEEKTLELAEFLKENDRNREAIHYLRKPASKGNAKANILLAGLISDSSNYYFEKAYELGNTDVFSEMSLYNAKSGELFKKASGKIDIAKLYYYKWLNVNGTKEERDSMLAILEATPIQHEDYYIFMGDRYFEGSGVESDFTKAEEYYKNAQSFHKNKGQYDYENAQIEYRISAIKTIRDYEKKSEDNDIESTLELLAFYAPKSGGYGGDDDTKKYNCEKINLYFKRAQAQIKKAESAEKSIKLYQYLFYEPVIKCMSPESKIQYWEDVKSNSNFMELLKYGNYYGDNHPDIQIGKVYLNDLKDEKMAKKYFKLAKKNTPDSIKKIATELLDGMKEK